MKEEICDGIYSTNGWDIATFHGDVSKKCYPSGKSCKNTVTFGGSCYNKWELNYYLWGLLNRVCGNSWRKTDFFANWAYIRPDDARCKNNFAKAGYFGNLAYVKARCEKKDCSTAGAPAWRILVPYYHGRFGSGGR